MARKQKMMPPKPKSTLCASIASRAPRLDADGSGKPAKLGRKIRRQVGTRMSRTRRLSPMVEITAQTTTSRCLTTSTYSDTNRLETTSGGGASTTQMSRDRYGLQPDKLVSIEHLLGEDAEHTRELQALAKEARQYITSFGWCRHVKA